MPRNYTVVLSATFAELKAYIDVSQHFYGEFASGSDHCCGTNISFAFSLVFPCTPSGFDGANVTDFQLLTPIYVRLPHPLGTQDVTQAIQSAIMEQFQKILKTTRIPWGGKPDTIPELISEMAKYNAPGGKLLCN